MRILVVTQYFWPENFRINDLCAELAQRGHEVTVLTGKPNYPDGDVFKEFKQDPSGFEQYNDCQVVRVPMIARGRTSLQLILNYLSFALSASLLGLFKLRKKQFDIIFVCQLSPVTSALPAILYKKIHNIPVTMWVLDLWPESLEAVGAIKSPRLLNLVGKLVSFVYNHCDLILGQSKSFIGGIGVYCKNKNKNKIKYFPSWPETIFSNNQNDVKNGEILKFSNSFNILFAGNIGEAQDFPTILKAVEILKFKDIKVKLFVVGDGRHFSWLKEQVEERKLNEYIYLLGRYPLEMMPRFYASADALLVTLRESKIFSMTIPGKVQSYMAAEKAILAMLDGEGARVIKEADCGYVSRSGDYKQLADSIIRMAKLDKSSLDKLGSNAKKYVLEEFDRNKLITQLEYWFTSIVVKDEKTL